MAAPIVAVLVQLLVPAFFIYDLWRGRPDTRLAWLLKLGYTSAFVLYVAIAGRWDWVSYYLRPALIVLLVIAALTSGRRMRGAPFSKSGASGGSSHRAFTLTALTILLFFVSLLAYGVRGYFYDGTAVQLAPPLRDGTYYVGQGGDSPLVNYHNTHPTQRYALDIVQLNTLGARAWGIYPTTLDRYVIFGTTVYSPCDGTIAEAVGDRADQIPPAREREQPAGNHVVIACGAVRVELAHLRKGSLRVRQGMAITAGEPIGQVGNSGNTSEPHLHIHATRQAENGDREPVPIRFGRTFAVRNTLLFD